MMKWLLALFLLCFASTATAQTPTAPAPAAPSPITQQDPTKLNDRERMLVRQAVTNVRDSYQRSRTSNGVSNIVSGVLIGGLGTYLYVSQDDPNLRLIGVAIAFSSVPSLVSGMWNIFYNTSQEDIADKLLSDARLLDGGGLLFVEQEARRARRKRFVGGSTSIVAGAATLGSYFLLKEFFLGGPDTILLVFFSVGAGIQVIQGIVSLVGRSGPERAYDDLISGLGRDPLAPKSEGTRISQMRVSPTVLGHEGKLAPALSLSLNF